MAVEEIIDVDRLGHRFPGPVRKRTRGRRLISFPEGRLGPTQGYLRR